VSLKDKIIDYRGTLTVIYLSFCGAHMIDISKDCLNSQ